MQKQKWFIIALVVLMALVTLPAQAQEGTDELTPEEMTAIVIAAYDHLRSAEYYTFTASQSELQIIGSGVGARRASLHRTTEREFRDGRVHIGQGGPDAVEVAIAQTNLSYINEQERSQVEQAVLVNLRLVDGNLYLQVDNVEGAQNQNEALPTAWVNMSVPPDQLTTYMEYLTLASADLELAILNEFNIDTVVNISSVPQLTPDMVENISQADSEDSDVLIFEIELRPDTMLEAMGMDTLLNTESVDGNLDVNLMLQQLFDGMTIVQTVTIEVDDDVYLLNSVQTELIIGERLIENRQVTYVGTEFTSEATGDVPLDLYLESTTTISYDDIGDEFEITVPGEAEE